MLDFIYSNVGYFLAGLLVLTAYYCAKSRDLECWFAAIILGLLALPAWIDTWSDPESMAVAHFTVISIALLVLNNGLLRRLSISICLMIFSDLLCVVHLTNWDLELTNASLFWWRSALNILFIYQCAITLRHGRAKVQYNQQMRHGSGNDGFFARHIHSNR